MKPSMYFVFILCLYCYMMWSVNTFTLEELGQQYGFNLNTNKIKRNGRPVVDSVLTSINKELGQLYGFNLNTNKIKGNGRPVVDSVLTSNKVLPAPSGVVVTRHGLNTIRVSWDQPKVYVFGYRVYYGLVDDDPIPTGMGGFVDICPFTIAEITGLDSNEPYFIRVAAKSSDGSVGQTSNSVQADPVNGMHGLKSCKSYEFQCNDRHCIPAPWLCDGEPDCIDQSDESSNICNRA